MGKNMIAPWSPKHELCFSVSALKETKDTDIFLPHVGRAVYKHFSQVFAFTLVMEEKNYTAMDSPVYGEADGINFISVEDWICMLALFKVFPV